MGFLYKREDHHAGYWYAGYIDANGKWQRRSTGTRRKKLAQDKLDAWEEEVQDQKKRASDPLAADLQNQSARPIAEHLKEFIDSVRSAGRKEKHATELEKTLEAMIERAGWDTARKIRPEHVESYAVAIKKDGRSARTVAKHMGYAKQFTRWLVQRGKIASDPLSGVRKPNPETDRRLERRAITFDEWPHLIRAAHQNGSIGELTAEARCLLYRFAVETGLRANEIRSLTRGRLHLKSKPPFVLVPKSTTKNAQLARQYLTGNTAQQLSKFIGHAGGAVFQLPHESELAAVLRDDLATARTKWIAQAKDGEEKERREKSDFLAAKNHEGEVIDFHSLRHTCGTWLAMRGENIKTVQSIMRHSTITLTADRYGHLFPAMDAEAVQRLSDPLRVTNE